MSQCKISVMKEVMSCLRKISVQSIQPKEKATFIFYFFHFFIFIFILE